MSCDNEYGLPKLVIDLFREKQSVLDAKLKWKIVGSPDFTQLTLTWTADKNSSPVTQYRYENVNSKPQGLYRKKSPSEIRRQRKRKEAYLQRKQEKKSVQNPMSIDQNAVSGSMNSVVNEGQSNDSNIHVQPKVVPPKPRPNVRTRSMAKLPSTPECPRKNDSRSDSDAHLVVSPVSPPSIRSSVSEASVISVDNMEDGVMANIIPELSPQMNKSDIECRDDPKCFQEALSDHVEQLESNIDKTFDTFMDKFKDLLK